MAHHTTKDPAPSVDWLYDEMLPAALAAAGFEQQSLLVYNRHNISHVARHVAGEVVGVARPRTAAGQDDPGIRARNALGPNLAARLQLIRDEHPRARMGRLADAVRTVLMCAAIVDRAGAEHLRLALRRPGELPLTTSRA